MSESHCLKRVLSLELLGNHLEFLRTHRGDVESHRGFHRCISQKSSFCFAILTTDGGFALASGHDSTLYVPDWLDLPREVGEQYRRSHVLNYLFLEGTQPEPQPDPSIRHVGDATSMEDFALAQARGFVEGGAIFAEWLAWLREADMRNLANPRQEFLVQYDGKTPVATTLTVFDSSFAGIYAVATVPSHRRQGRALSLLRSAVANARSRGFSFIGLQTVEGSPAEKLYMNAGFRALFKMFVLTRITG